METSKYLIILFFFLSLFSNNIYSQATRTWVSGVGDDANPCSRTAPCKTFAGAISKTAAGGEISVLDPGGFGSVTITKSITINGDGTLAGILSSLTNGIIVNAGVNDVVTIRSISINGGGNGTNGVRFLAGKHLIVDNCSISGFTTFGIDVNKASGTSMLTVINTSITGPSPSASGINLSSTSDTIKTNLRNVQINGLTTAILANSNSVVIGENCDFTQNQKGVNAKSNAIVNLENCLISNNKTGVLAENTSIIRLSNNSIYNNSDAGIGVGTGKVISFGNNRLAGNTTNAPMGVISQQ